MACQGGITALTDEAGFYKDTDFPIALAAVEGFHGKALWTFLDHNNYWQGGSFLLRSDTIAESFWKKRNDLPRISPAVETPAIQQLEQAISDYFYRKQGRGRNCKVEVFHRFDKVYFFAYPEDYSQQSIEWVDGEFAPRPHNPAFEIIFVYSKKEGSLDLHFRGSYKAIEPLQGMFATAILKLDELPPDPKDARVYDLAPLLQKSFDFVPAVGSGIEKVVVKKLRLSSRVKKGDRITLEADTTANPNAVYALLEQIGKTLPMNQYNITQVELAATVVENAGKPAKTVTIRITHPNSCSLKYDEMDLKLRDMLVASGIEPRVLAEELCPCEA